MSSEDTEKENPWTSAEIEKREKYWEHHLEESVSALDSQNESIESIRGLISDYFKYHLLIFGSVITIGRLMTNDSVNISSEELIFASILPAFGIIYCTHTYQRLGKYRLGLKKGGYEKHEENSDEYIEAIKNIADAYEDIRLRNREILNNYHIGINWHMVIFGAELGAIVSILAL